MLAVVTRFKWVHIDYLNALAEHFDLVVAYAGEGGQGAAQDGIRAGVRGVRAGVRGIRAGARRIGAAADHDHAGVTRAVARTASGGG